MSRLHNLFSLTSNSMTLTKVNVSKVILWYAHIKNDVLTNSGCASVFMTHDFNISPRYPFEQVLQSSGFRLNIWNGLCCSSSVHVYVISATDTSNALCIIHLQKTMHSLYITPTTVWHDCLSRMSVREMPKMYILTYYLYFVYREETFVFHYWCVSEWDWLFWVTFDDISVIECDGTYIDVQADRRRSWTYGQAPTP